ncbi:Ubiquitin-protein ligase E3B, partial [Cladochytrium tenue]
SVTNSNKHEYLHLVSDYRLNRECRSQFAALVAGFRTLARPAHLAFFAPAELQRLMSGDAAGDFLPADLRAAARYEGGYHDLHPTIRAFWQSQLLKFVTSCSHPPVGGFAHLDPPFTIRLADMAASSGLDNSASALADAGRAVVAALGFVKDSAKLPTSATCFNVLK